MFILSMFLMSDEIKASLLGPIYPTLAVIVSSPVNLVSNLMRRHAELGPVSVRRHAGLIRSEKDIFFNLCHPFLIVEHFISFRIGSYAD